MTYSTEASKPAATKPVAAKSIGTRNWLGALSLAFALAGLAGCTMGPIQLSGPAATGAVQLHLAGTVHGGQQPVSGATIQLYVVGASGYGSTATPLIPSGEYQPGGASGCIGAACTTSVTTDSSGSFTITGDYTCPTTGSGMVYLMATGGNPGLTSGTNNAALALAAPLGACSSIGTNTFIVVNEVTTAAAAYALGQYFTPTFGSGSSDSFGAPNTTQAQLGMSNAFATVNSLVNTSTGNAVQSTTLTGAGSSVTAVPEYLKLQTVADILASCVNSTGTSDPGGACTTLFNDTARTGSTAPSDTLQAAVDLSLNPTSNSPANVSTLFGLATANPPFPALASAPTDWTLGIQYQDNVGTFFLKPQNLAVDAYGNVWVLSNNGGNGNLVQLSPTGTPLTNVASLSEYGPFQSPVADPPVVSSPKNTTTTFTTQNYVFTTTFGAANNNPGINPRNLAIDPSNNVWFTSSSSATSSTGGSDSMTSVPANGAVFEIATTGGVPTGSTFGFDTGKSAYGLAIDGAGDVFVGQESSSAYLELFEFPYNATPGNAFLTPIGFPIASATAGTAGTAGTNTFIEPEYMAFDPSGNLWIDEGSISASTNNFVVELANINTSSCGTLTQNNLCVVTTSTTANTYNNYSLVGAPTQPYGLAADSTAMFVADSATGNGVNLIPYATPAANTLVGTTATFTLPRYLAVDGGGNVWVANYNGTPGGTNPTVGGSISEVSSSGTILSPSTSSTTTTNPGYVHAGLNAGSGTAIDPSGNVWIANNAAYVTGTPSSVFELVGAAAPTVTPIAEALATTAVGAKP